MLNEYERRPQNIKLQITPTSTLLFKLIKDTHTKSVKNENASRIPLATRHRSKKNEENTTTKITCTFQKCIHFFDLTDLNFEIYTYARVLLSLKDIIKNKVHQNNYIKIAINISSTIMGFKKLIWHNIDQISEIQVFVER